MTLEKSKYYHITYTKEISDTFKLIEKIKEENWVDSATVIVNCMPDYSSIPCQIINHKLSYLNQNELFEQISLELPYPVMSQVWDRQAFKYEQFDRYLLEWVSGNIGYYYKYLFITSNITTGKSLFNIGSILRSKIGRENYRFGTLYLDKDAKYKPDYYAEEFSANEKGNILFEWENSQNPNWNY